MQSIQRESIVRTVVSATPVAIVSIDLVAASYRSSSFPKEWSSEQREREAKRYELFLALAARYPGKPATPTREIDEFWHLHMLHPQAYYDDCMRLFGHIFDHDGGFGNGPGELPMLKSAFRDFARRWEKTYRAPYTVAGPSVDSESTDCWHQCKNCCWHACSSKK